jgi:hypothetical protein
MMRGGRFFERYVTFTLVSFFRETKTFSPREISHPDLGWTGIAAAASNDRFSFEIYMSMYSPTLYVWTSLVICKKYRDGANLWGSMLQIERKVKR